MAQSPDPCWVKGCNGEHDRFIHPKHRCPKPPARERPEGFLIVCTGCSRVWRRTQGALWFDMGWELAADPAWFQEQGG